MAFRNILRLFPTYYRCPYLNCGSTALLSSLGYHILDMDLDTKDYLYDDPSLIQTSKNKFSTKVSNASSTNSYIPLAHDIHYQTVANLTAFMINTLKARGYKPVTVGECLGDPAANWYRSADGAGTYGGSSSSATVSAPTSASIAATPSPSSAGNNPPSSSTLSTVTTPKSRSSSTSSSSTSNASGLAISTNQVCGGTSGQTCQGSKFGNCCSYYGFCGSSTTYCGAGCNPAFGFCSPSSTNVTLTPNGLCGASYKTTCLGYGVKQCCSQYGYCGNSTAYCGSGCQTVYGICT